MGIRVFISGNSGNKEIVTHQGRILMILDSLNIENEVVDITAPGMDEARKFMRENGKKKDGERNVLPPQIFNGDKYCGDYEDFDVANEDDVLEEFLGIPRKSPKLEGEGGSNPEGDAGKLEGQPAVNGSPDKVEALKEEAKTIEEDRLSQNNEPAETAETPGDLDQKSIEENNTHENDTENDHEGKFETHESNKIPDFPTPDTTNDTEVDASLEENENLA